jgi:hypothetical protein
VLVLLVATRALPTAFRASRSLRRGLEGDRPTALLELAIRWLPAECDDWGRAMRGELVHVRSARARWGFSVGCLRAAALLRARATIRRPAPGAAAMRAVALAGIVCAVALVAYGIVRYPDLRSAAGFWPSVATFAVVTFAYAAAALALSSSAAQHGGLARRYGLVGGLAVGAAWFLVFSPTDLLKAWVAVPLAVAPFGAACVSALAGRAARDAAAATQAALWSGLVGGLVVFAVCVTVTYARDGRPYDTGLLREFHRSGAPNLAAYAVGDDLGSGLVLLMLVPIVALALGSLTGRLAARPSR